MKQLLVTILFMLAWISPEIRAQYVNADLGRPDVPWSAQVSERLVASGHVSSVGNKVTGLLPKAMPVIPDKTAYAFLLDNADLPQYMGMASFQLPKPDVYTQLSLDDWEYVSYSGVCVDEVYYGYICRFNLVSGAAFTKELATFDFATRQWNTVCQLSGSWAETLSDITYDYSTGKAYGIMNTGMFQSSLYELSLTDGSLTFVCSMDAVSYIVAIACTYDGQLYGMGTGGDLYRINKSNGSLTSVGNTGYMPWFLQTMEFDHTDETLYWAGADAEHTFLATVDINTAAAVEVGTFIPGCNVTGLYVPYTLAKPGTPGYPLDFKATAGQRGELYATLSWRNPSTDPFGAIISGAMGVRIYRDDQLIGEITDTTVGATCTYRDDSPTTGNRTYRIECYNATGTGEDAHQTVWIGEDYPNEPQEIKVRANNGKVELTWTIPETGAHGGWVNRNRIYSSISRMQDGAQVMDRQITNTGTDDQLTELERWSYYVTLSDEAGNKATAQSDTIVAGPGLALPYFNDFNADDDDYLWSIRSVSGDTATWKHYQHPTNGRRYLQYRSSYYYNGDDYALAPPVTMQAGRDYRISFDLMLNWMKYGSEDHLRVLATQSPTEGAVEWTIADLTLSEWDAGHGSNPDWNRRQFDFSPPADGDYYIGVYVYSSIDQCWINIDNFQIEELYYYDLEVTDLAGPSSALAGHNTTYSITVHNKGSRSAEGFTVRLVDAQGNVLSDETLVTEPLAADATATYQVNMNIAQTGDYQVLAEVAYSNDADPSNNRSTQPMTVSITEQGDYSITIGDPSGEGHKYAFMHDYQPNLVWLESLYTSIEVNAPTNGLISQLDVYSTDLDIAPCTFPVKVFLGNTEATEMGSEIATSEMTQVYEGTVTFDQAESCYEIAFSQPFLYTGGNIVLRIERNGNDTGWRGVEGGMVVAECGYNVSMECTGFRTHNRTYRPVITLHINASGNSVGGTVTDQAGTPLPGVTVTNTANGMVTTTDQQGQYGFALVSAGTCNFTYALHGYFTQDKTITVSEEPNTPVTQDVTLAKMPTTALTVTVTNGTSPVAGATVTLNGYDPRTATTNANGQAIINDLICSDEDYTITIDAIDYEQHQATLKPTAGTATASCTLTPIAYPVDNFAMQDADAPVLSWGAPVRLSERRYDDGVATTRSGRTPDDQTPDVSRAIFGIIEQTPGTVKQLSWYLVETEGRRERDNVCIYFFDLNADGTPQSTPKKVITGITSTVNEWFTYTLDEPYTATGSFYVALACADDYLGLGVDGSHFNPTEQYPEREMLQYYAHDYTEQFYVAAIWYKGNFMLRLQMADQVPQQPTSIGLLGGYNVYRFLAADRNDRSAWTRIAQTGATTLTDAELPQQPQGYYRYGVTAVWADGLESEPAISEIVEKDMLTAVTVQLQSAVQSAGAFDGTQVKLQSADGLYSYSGTISGTASQILFPQVSKGDYTLTISHKRYDEIVAQVQPNPNDSYTYSYTLVEKLSAPANLTATAAGEAGTYDLTWNFSSNIFEDFEGHADFTLNSPGTIGWNYLDNDDNEYTYGFSLNGEMVSYDNWGVPTAYIIFNPSATDPRCDSEQNINAYSGDKFLGSFASSMGRNDDFIISPELFFDDDFNFSFYARSYTDMYGSEQMMVGYSTTDIEPESFQWFNGGSAFALPTAWSQYTFTVPAEARYVAIRCVSSDSFLFMVDDIQIGSGQAEAFTSFALRYEIYVDGTKVAQTTTNTYQGLNVGEGRHTIGVRAIYETGTSEMTEITVGGSSSVGQVGAAADWVRYYDRHLWFDGTARRIDVYNTAGTLAATWADAEGPVNLAELQRGIYIATVVRPNGKKNIVKFIIR